MKLFDAINKQTAFEEKTLIQKFKAYPSMKVHLKEMITDSLVLYYRNRHPHIDLLSQIQKVHVLLMKGMQDEALKILDKAMKQAEQMELFTVERYLARMHYELTLQKTLDSFSTQKLLARYKSKMQENSEAEANLTSLELLGIEWLGKVIKGNVYNKPAADSPATQILNLPAKSLRGEMKRLSLLRLQHFNNSQWLKCHEMSKKFAPLATKFRQEHDFSFNDVPFLINYAGDYLNLEKIEESLKVIDKMLDNEAKQKLYFEMAFVKGTLHKLNGYFHLGRFKEGLTLIETSEKQMLFITAKNKDTNSLMHFIFRKLLFLFVNKKHRECWLALQELKMKELIEKSSQYFVDYTFLQLMTQLELSNYEIVKDMVLKFEKVYKKNGINDFTFLTLLKFFKKVSPLNKKEFAAETLKTLTAHYSATATYPRKIFVKLRYTYWLEEISGGRTIQKSLQEQFGG